MYTTDNYSLLNTLSANSTIFYSNQLGLRASYSAQFWFYLSFHIPSGICYLFLLPYILIKKTERQALHNHSILALLIVAFSVVIFDYSWKIDSYYRNGNVWSQVPFLCQIWWLIDYGFYDACTVILAWSSFERHILIFHSHLVATRRKRIAVHYLPLILIIIYLAIFYIYAIFFPSCENEYDFSIPLCGADPCVYSIMSLSIWITMVHGILPSFLIAIFNTALILRVLWQRVSHRQDWRKCRKMAFQLLFIAILYLSINLPYMFIVLIHLVGYANVGNSVESFLFDISSLIHYLLPFVCLISLSITWTTLQKCCKHYDRRVAPAMTIATRQRQMLNVRT